MKTLLSKENQRKIRLIKKYAKIRFKRFWKEWGVNKEDIECLLGGFLLLGFVASTYILGYIFL